jgi:hypothetical protein
VEFNRNTDDFEMLVEKPVEYVGRPPKERKLMQNKKYKIISFFMV